MCVIHSSHSFHWVFLKPCILSVDIMKSACGDLMKMKLILTEKQPFKLSHFEQFSHNSVWTLYNHLISQFSTNHFQTLHTFCRHNKDMHVEF